MDDSIKSLVSASLKSLTGTSAITPSDTDEPTICDFKILSETLPIVFLLSGDNRYTMADACTLEVSLAGTLILAERFGNYPWRCLTWLWQYGLRRHSSTTIRITAEGPDIRRGGRLFLISGCSPPIQMHESALKGRLSGRLMVREFTKQSRPSFLSDEVRRLVVRMFGWPRLVTQP
ncbi:uncharacterized protein RSE6_14824 [Rhynchosporium secalis]|uniref:Uncharacterized protein n=1 Tax=Rhynchosporium secalis TaxID=38038 RepID=A0A1E1MW76_RHYSE|nr:uncharacterized protein RSE6_14824 [Rhynchosporium secalis]